MISQRKTATKLAFLYVMIRFWDRVPMFKSLRLKLMQRLQPWIVIIQAWLSRRLLTYMGSETTSLSDYTFSVAQRKFINIKSYTQSHTDAALQAAEEGYQRDLVQVERVVTNEIKTRDEEISRLSQELQLAVQEGQDYSKQVQLQKRQSDDKVQALNQQLDEATQHLNELKEQLYKAQQQHNDMSVTSSHESISDTEKDVIIRKLKQAMVRAREEIIRLRTLEQQVNNGEYHIPQKVSSNSTTSNNNATTAVVASNNGSQQQENVHVTNIYKVLLFWFGQGSPDESQKQLWMIASQSVQVRERVDAEITKEFTSLLKELVEQQQWKHWAQIDLQEGSNISSNNNNNNNLQNIGFFGKIAAIVVLDQFSRHILRHFSNQQSNITNVPSQQDCDKIALQISNALIRTHATELRTGMIPIPMLIFGLMPYRHSGEKQSTQLVRNHIDGIEALLKQIDNMCGRFRKATTRRLADFEDADRRGNDNGKTEHSDEDILAHYPFPADLSEASTHAVYKTIRAFLASRCIVPPSDEESPKLTPIIISLSGGVDSMVIASILAYMVREHRYPLTLHAVHIDYANRPESQTEAEFIQRFCEDEGILYYCRRIDEVTRGVTARDEYEKMSREIRYQFYRDTVELARKESDEPGVSMGRVEVGVVLGHHRGDLRENVLSNAHKGCGPLDLSGMTHVSQNDGVTIYRPLLPLEKSFVYSYAHLFGVPYFKDTTPHWSTRGQLRNKLLPLLEDIYGEGSMNNLSNLAVESDECRSLLHNIALGPFLERVDYSPVGITFPTEEWLDQGMFFWKYVLREALHSAGLGMFTDKSVKTFLDRVRADPINEGWLQCRKDYAVYLRSDGQVYVLYANCFPWRKADAYQVTGQQVFYGHENAAVVGPWRVTALMLGRLNAVLSSQDIQERLEKKAIADIDEIMDGKIDYYVEVPTWESHDGTFEARPLVFTDFNKANRPKAWKNTDTRLQDTLPLLGNDDMALQALKDPAGWNTMHKDEDGNECENPVLLVHVILSINDDSLTDDCYYDSSDSSFIRRASMESIGSNGGGGGGGGTNHPYSRKRQPSIDHSTTSNQASTTNGQSRAGSSELANAKTLRRGRRSSVTGGFALGSSHSSKNSHLVPNNRRRMRRSSIEFSSSNAGRAKQQRRTSMASSGEKVRRKASN